MGRPDAFLGGWSKTGITTLGCAVLYTDWACRCRGSAPGEAGRRRLVPSAALWLTDLFHQHRPTVAGIRGALRVHTEALKSGYGISYCQHLQDTLIATSIEKKAT